jgi:hypothetical protein
VSDVTTGARGPGGTAPGSGRPTAAKADVGGADGVGGAAVVGGAADGAPDQVPLQPACPTTTATNVTRTISSLLGMGQGGYVAPTARMATP